MTQRRVQAAAEVLAVQWQYASQARSLATAALAGAQQFVEWAHHPRGDHVDRASGARFYYHAHAAEERAPLEHGHFHLFVPAPGEPQSLSHLVGLSIDAKGLPLRLFTTNRWVTGEAWRAADALARVVPHFTLHASGRLGPVARWLTGMVALYDDVITDLLHERDARLGRDPAVLDDRTLHIVSELPVSLPERLRSIEALHPVSEEKTHVPCP
jgi:hypothetical protein